MCAKVIRLVSSVCSSFKMAPPPEYDKEPKAPDKSVTTVSNDDSKVIYNTVKDQPTNSEHKNVTAGANAEGEVS